MYETLIREAVDYHADLVRNIHTIRVSQDLFDDLSDDPADFPLAIAAEGAGRVPTDAPLLTRPFDYGTVITFPFARFNGQQTRFSDGLHYGVWYGSLELETTVYETVYHRHRFILDSYAGENRVIAAERRAFEVRCDAVLFDLRGREMQEPRLVDRRSYAFTQPLGRYLRDQGAHGLLVRSARCPGSNAALFRAQPLSGVRDLCHLTYRLNPAEDLVTVERMPGETWLSVVPSSLA